MSTKGLWTLYLNMYLAVEGTKCPFSARVEGIGRTKAILQELQEDDPSVSGLTPHGELACGHPPQRF